MLLLIVGLVSVICLTVEVIWLSKASSICQVYIYYIYKIFSM